MKDRGKALEVYNSNNKKEDMFSEYENCLSELQCRKHPSASSVGICAQCLKDRLTKLVCSECGEQRLSSCSCSDLSSSNRNSCTVEVGSVGRISFLLENEKSNESSLPLPLQLPVSLSHSHSNSKLSKLIDSTKDEVMLLKRSNSSCVEIKKSNGIWRIGRFFRKKRGKDKDGYDKASVNGGVGFDAKSEIWVVDNNVGVGMNNGSRSRSMNSFKGCGIFGSEDGDWGLFSGARSSVSGPRASSVNMGFDPERKSGFSEVEPRRSGFSEAEPRKSCFSEGEPRKSGFSSETEPRRSGFFDDGNGSNGSCKVNPNTNRRIFSLKESDFTGFDDKGFIDLKFFSSDGNSNTHTHTNTNTNTNTNTTKSEFSGAKTVNNGSNTSVSHLGAFAGSKSAFGSMRSVDDGNRSSIGSFIGDGDYNSGSFRMTGSDRGSKKSRKSFRGWKWVFRHHPSPFHSKKKEEGEDLSHVR